MLTLRRFILCSLSLSLFSISFCLPIARADKMPTTTITTTYDCIMPETGEHYLTNVQASIPKDCTHLKIKTFRLPRSEVNGLRATEQAPLHTQNPALSEQRLSDSLSGSLSGLFEDNRQDKCFAYRSRIAEARADRKNDVKLNRQIQRDLSQMQYYCR